MIDIDDIRDGYLDYGPWLWLPFVYIGRSHQYISYPHSFMPRGVITPSEVNAYIYDACTEILFSAMIIIVSYICGINIPHNLLLNKQHGHLSRTFFSK